MNTLGIYFRKLLRNFPPTKNTLLPIKTGPLKGNRFSVKYGDPYLYHEYENDIIDFVLSKSDKSTVIYDIGANVGYLSMAFATKTSKIYAVEPIQENIDLMKRHFNENNVNDINIYQFGITNKDKQLKFSTGFGSVSNTYVKESEYFKKGSMKQTTIVGRSIDSLVFNDKWEVPNIIKLDVEGAEDDALIGAKKTLLNYSPIVLLATHDCHKPGVKEKCLKIMNSYGYNCTTSKEVKTHPGLDDFICIKKP